MWNTESWLKNDEAGKLEYSDYWNDEEEEKGKEWYVLDGDFSRMEGYLQKTGLPEDLEKCIRILRIGFERQLAGVGIDLAAGNLWAVPHLSSLGKVDKLYCLEYSKHRLLKIGPKVLEHYKVPEEKIILVYGSFYDLHIQDNSLDFAFLSQSFHHAHCPDKLLLEIHRVLKPGGIVIIIGEHVVNWRRLYFKHVVKFFISLFVPEVALKRLSKRSFSTVNKLIPRPSELFPVEPTLGDHHYTIVEYKRLFSRCGFRIVKHLKPIEKSKFQSFILIRGE